MKPFYQKLVPALEQSFIFYEEELPHFIVPWHYHPEIEILLVVKSTGTNYVGDSINSFGAGDVCLLGGELPHWWKSDNKYLQEKSNLSIKTYVIQFRKELFESLFLSLPEMEPVSQLIERSQRGIRFLGESRIKIGRMIRQNFREEGMKRIAGLLILLEVMANEKEYEYLASISFSKKLHTDDFQRFNQIYEYIIRHFNEPINLEDIADKANMVPTSFCRYFRKRTGKSFSAFLNEYRVGQANRMLAETKIKISSIAQECGFNNLSNFNEQYKKIMGSTPKEYREQF